MRKIEMNSELGQELQQIRVQLGIGYAPIVVVVAIMLALLASMTMLIWSEEDPDLKAYVFPTGGFVFVSVSAVGALLLSSRQDSTIVLYEHGFHCKGRELLYRDVTSIKLGFDEMNDFYQQNDALTAYAIGDKLGVLEAGAGYAEQTRRDQTVYIGLSNGELIELERALTRYRRADLEKLRELVREHPVVREDQEEVEGEFSYLYEKKLQPVGE